MTRQASSLWSRSLAILASLAAAFLFAVLLSPSASAASTYSVTDATATVGTDATLEIEYTVDTAEQTWADADTLTVQLPANFPQWGSLTFTAEYDTDTTNDDTGETAIGAGAGNGQYAVSTDTITIKWDVSTWGAVVNGASTIRIVVTAGDAPQYADATSTFTFGGTTANVGDSNPTGTDNVNVSAADAAASLTLANPSVGAAGDATLTLTLPVDLAASDTIVFTAPSILDVSSVAFSSETFSGGGTISGCTPSSQVITCTSGGAITAGTGNIVMTGITATNTGTSTITSLAVNDNSAGDADIATDASGPVTTVVSNQSDSNPPAAPTNVQVASANGEVTITWTDPEDSDLDRIEILRGVGLLPVSGSVYDVAEKGAETYTDMDVTVGEEVKYILRSKDGSGNVALSDEYSVTVVDSAAPTSTSTTTGSTTTTTPETTTPETTTPTTTTTPDDRYTEAGVTETQVNSAVAAFSDLVKSAWHSTFIARMRDMDILAGYPDGTVRPDVTINRAELAKIAAKAFGLPTYTESFTDVPDDAWYAPFVGALQKVGAAWTPTTNYQPAADVSRGEALWVLLTAAGVNLDGITIQKLFPDVNTKHRYAAAITYAAQNGIVSGYDNGNFGPGDTLTRAQVAKIVTLIKDM